MTTTDESPDTPETPPPTTPADRLAVVAFVVTRIAIFGFLLPISSDTFIYFKYSVQDLDLGQTPFVDYDVEYPPLAYWVMRAPRAVSSDRLTEETRGDRERVARQYGWYRLTYRAEMLLFDVLAFVLFWMLLRRRRPEYTTVAVWCYVIVTAIFGHVLYDRTDVVLTALLLMWLLQRTYVPDTGGGGAANVASYVLLGLGIAYKLVGIVAVPFVLLSDLNATPGSFVRRCGVMLGLLAVTVLATAFPFLVHAQAAGTKSLNFLKYHGDRGIEIASSYGTALLTARAFGYPVETEISYGSANLASSWSERLTRLSPYVLLAVLAWQGLRALLRGREEFDRPAGDRAGAIAIVTTLFLSKVLSAQYLVFGLPLAMYVATTARSPGRFAGVAALTVLLAALTTVVFPYLWFPYIAETDTTNPYPLVPNLHPLPVTLLIARNVLFAGLMAVLLTTPRRWEHRDPAEKSG